jgi:hypothetical protein
MNEYYVYGLCVGVCLLSVCFVIKKLIKFHRKHPLTIGFLMRNELILFKNSQNFNFVESEIIQIDFLNICHCEIHEMKL